MLSSDGDWIGIGIIAMPLIVIVATVYLLRELRMTEPQLFDALGRPHIWFTNLDGLSFLFGFVLLGEYRSRVKDQRLKKICMVVQILTWVWLATFFAFLVYAFSTAS